MIRSAIRTLIRIEADDLTESPKGLFTNDSLDILINVAQRKLQLKLIRLIPWMFRKNVTFDFTIAKTDYDIATDLVITDLLMFETIVHNKANTPAKPLYFYSSPNDFWMSQDYVGATGSDPAAWAYLDKDTITILPTASGTVADRLKAFYFFRIPDLNHDSSDVSPNVATPHMDASLHGLIAYEVLLRYMIRDKDGEIYRIVATKAANEFEEAMEALTMPQGFSTGRLPGAGEYLDISYFSANITG